ncbi:septum-promoting GTP-binding protein 1 isoform X2 [Hevea brasiliensis]|uniref:septum-promoting GTP-binding protein 1 isoform X2 n=1 Tax=Hevea brasiliensis TaxID=3981 RepID=UPI0025DF78F7|nr:septum-promoting GTP-binding protein 1 isoform X2 [Hevea brasiliensis]
MVRFNLRLKLQRRISIIRRSILRLWNEILMCSVGKPIHCRMLPPHHLPVSSSSETASGEFVSGIVTPSPPPPTTLTAAEAMFHNQHEINNNGNKDSDLVALKISLLGDCQIGKTSFLAKYVGNEIEEGRILKDGMNMMDKTLLVKGDEGSIQQIPLACKDSVAILIMFDLTSRLTLNSVIKWYQEARKWNQTAIPIIIGTKFDDFIQLPIDLQWAIASQARAYAKALNATLFFSSATYNINVNKIFKFITAKLFDLPWKPERNLTIGEPIIDF